MIKILILLIAILWIGLDKSHAQDPIDSAELIRQIYAGYFFKDNDSLLVFPNHNIDISKYEPLRLPDERVEVTDDVTSIVIILFSKNELIAARKFLPRNPEHPDKHKESPQ